MDSTQLSSTRTVLIVDDTSTNLEFLSEYLLNHGFATLTAESGEEALLLALSQAPDLILLDILMPGLDGFETCRRLKIDPNTHHIPVIFMSALHEMPAKNTGFAVGGVDYLAKPFDLDEVVMRVRTHCTLAIQQREIEHKNGLLTEQLDQLRILNQEKDHFLRVAAHNLNNPLASILMSAEYLTTEPALDPQGRDEILQVITHEAQYMSELITELLETNALEQGRIVLQRIPFDLVDVLSELVENFAGRAARKEQSISLKVPQAKCEVIADPEAVSRVVSHLLSNAVKYVPVGGKIGLELLATGSMMQCIVSDNGPGLSELDQRALFTKFSHLTPRPTGGESSVGLGLVIVRTLVQMMGGKIWCESVLGQGCRFVVEFPAWSEGDG